VTTTCFPATILPSDASYRLEKAMRKQLFLKQTGSREIGGYPPGWVALGARIGIFGDLRGRKKIG
jgi:hypothetical protein